MDQTITTVCSVFWDDGRKVHLTEYHASCGCQWNVDMWGYVRRVSVCPNCNDTTLPWEDQLGFDFIRPVAPE